MNTEKFMNFMQEHILPVAVKIGEQKHLVALRNAFIGTMPVVMTGSIAVLLNAFLVDVPDQFGLTWITEKFQWFVDINNLIFQGSLAIVALLFIYSLGSNIAETYNTERLSGGLVALAAFAISIGQSMTKAFSLDNTISADVANSINQVAGLKLDGNNLLVTINGLLPGNQISSRGYFTAIIIGFFASVIFCKIMNENWTIKLPDTVPPAIAKPFLAIIPGFIALYSVGIFTYIFNKVTGELLIDWVYKVLQAPLLGLSQSYIAVLLVAVLTQLFWFFGIHGGNVMAPIMEGIFGVALIANMEAFQTNQPLPYLWTSVSFGSFVWYATLGLLIAIFWTSKNSHYKEVAKLGIVPVMFNIGEPVMYGLPTVSNPLLCIPFILSPAIMTTVSYFATSLGLVAPVAQNVTWVMPPVLYGFFATGFDWRAIVLSLINILIATMIYLPFVKLADRQEFQE
ncbi:PTS sugar transporter subunit IIC [Clostridium butyricum]